MVADKGAVSSRAVVSIDRGPSLRNGDYRGPKSINSGMILETAPSPNRTGPTPPGVGRESDAGRIDKTVRNVGTVFPRPPPLPQPTRAKAPWGQGVGGRRRACARGSSSGGAGPHAQEQQNCSMGAPQGPIATNPMSNTTVAIEPHLQATPLGLPLSLFALAGGTLIEQGFQQLPGLLMALGAFAGGIATLLPAVTAFLDRRQQRRHAEVDRRRPCR